MTPAINDRIWDDLRRPTPDWLPAAKLGIFIHWGPYSVPAWAEPSGALGAVPESEWFKHNAYAEWYFNTIRIPGSPAAQHHHDIYHDAPYDDFLDQWTATKFDPTAWARLFAEAGASYVVPTTKHHDGVTLWDAPGTGTRNTVHRGPRRDLIGEIAEGVRAAGLRFGVYYSGGLDWSITDLPPLTSHLDVLTLRPNEHEGESAWENCRGIGFSFGYNQAEDERQILSGRQLACHLTDVVSRGGRLLLNVGPTAEGEIPDIQQVSLRSLGRWMAQVGDVITAAQPVPQTVAHPTDHPWVRWLETREHLVAVVDQVGETTLNYQQDQVSSTAAELVGASGSVAASIGSCTVNVDELIDGPAALLLPKL
jgi:alpha-L-fucosidase